MWKPQVLTNLDVTLQRIQTELFNFLTLAFLNEHRMKSFSALLIFNLGRTRAKHEKKYVVNLITCKLCQNCCNVWTMTLLGSLTYLFSIILCVAYEACAKNIRHCSFHVFFITNQWQCKVNTLITNLIQHKVTVTMLFTTIQTPRKQPSLWRKEYWEW